MVMPAASALPVQEHPDLQRLYAAHAAATAWFRTQLHRNHGPMAYLRGRGLDAVVDHDTPWRIGYAPPTWTGLVNHLRDRRFTDAELLQGGLAFRGRDGRLLDRFRDRIMFPCRDRDGRIVGYTGRIWHPPPPHGWQDAPKYLNSPDTPIYHKSQVLFGLREQRDRTDTGYSPVIVEGPTDALAIWTTYSRAGRAGFVGLATCGTTLTTSQLDLAASLPSTRRHGMAIAFDGDTAGRKATEHAYQMIADRHPGLPARGVRLATGTDPADLARTPEGRAQLRAALRQAQPLLHLVIDDRVDRLLTRNPQSPYEVQGRLLLARAILPLIAEQPATVITGAVGHVADAVAARLGDTPQATSAVGETVHSLTSVVTHYLETTPPPPHQGFRPPLRDGRPPAAFPARPAPGSPSAPSAGPLISATHVRAAQRVWGYRLTT